MTGSGEGDLDERRFPGMLSRSRSSGDADFTSITLLTGNGLEVAGGLSYTPPRLHAEDRGRWLAPHLEIGAGAV